MAFNHISLYGNTHQGGYLDQIASLIRILLSRGLSLDIEAVFARYLADNGIDIAPLQVTRTLPVVSDAIISIGGDGTFLHAAQWAGASETPILGINTGHLGFLASYTLDEAEILADMLKRGDAVVEHRSLLKLEGEGVPENLWPYALNEVAILKEDTASMIDVAAGINGFKLADYRADGLIIATPTGSTAYSMSAAGPIMEPTLECIILSPVAPHTLTLRPLVVGGDSDITLAVTSRASHFRVSLDGRSFVLPCGTNLRVRKALFTTAVIRRPGDDFAAILRSKLLWGR